MKVVVIGVGRMGRRHVQAARELGLEVAGVADPSPQALALAEKELGVAPSRQSREGAELLGRVRPEGVVIATTAEGHAPLTCLAAEIGARWVLCEKPMAVSLAECDRMIAACARAGTRLAINHQMRFMEAYREPRRLLDSEGFGDLTSMTVVAGNMGVVMNGTHYFEAMRFVSGQALTEAAAWFGREIVPNPRGAQFADRAGQVRATTADGRRLYIECGADQGHGVKAIYAARHGQIVVDELAGLIYATAREPQDRPLATTRYGMPSVNTLRTFPPPDMVALSKRVLEALAGGGDAPDGAEGRAAVAAAVAAHVSDETGHAAVTLDARLPAERVFPWA